MKKGLLILAVLTFSLGFSQTEKQNYKDVASQFQKHFNNGDTVSIFNMFDSTMQKQMPLERTQLFFEKQIQITEVGKIKTMVLDRVERTAHTYRTTCENAVFDVFFLLNDANEISGFQMFPKARKLKN